MKWVKLPNGRFTRPTRPRPTPEQERARQVRQGAEIAAMLPRINGRFATRDQVAEREALPQPTRWLDWKRQA